jgi:hypothetical protein
LFDIVLEEVGEGLLTPFIFSSDWKLDRARIRVELEDIVPLSDAFLGTRKVIPTPDFRTSQGGITPFLFLPRRKKTWENT